MAQYHASFTQAKLAQIYARDAETADDARLLAAFGRPLARVTQEAYGLTDRLDQPVPHAFLSRTGLLTYNELGRAPHYVDSAGRQYFAYGVAAPNQAYCRIPKGLTAAQNRGEHEIVDLPFANETITLVRGTAWGRKNSEARSVPSMEVTVLQRLDQTKAGAVGLLLLSDELVAPDGLDVIPEEEEENVVIDPLVRKRLEHITTRVEQKAARFRDQGIGLPDNQELQAKARVVSHSGRRPHLKAPKMSRNAGASKPVRLGKLKMSKRG